MVLDALAWATFLCAAILRFWATLYIGGRKGHTVVAEGPYSLCRHPLYVGTFLLALSAALFLDSPTFLVGVLVLAGFYTAFTIPAEERHLLAEFGEDYRSYCRRTSRLIPFLKGRLHSEAHIEVKLGALWIEMKRGFLWLLLPAICEILSTFRSKPWWPHPFNLP